MCLHNNACQRPCHGNATLAIHRGCSWYMSLWLFPRVWLCWDALLRRGENKYTSPSSVTLFLSPLSAFSCSCRFHSLAFTSSFRRAIRDSELPSQQRRPRRYGMPQGAGKHKTGATSYTRAKRLTQQIWWHLVFFSNIKWPVTDPKYPSYIWSISRCNSKKIISS